MTETIAAPDTFESFFTAHYASLARVLYRVVGDFQLAEELAAEAFWKLHVSKPESDRNLTGWVYRTGLRLALDSLRKRRRRSHYEALSASPVPLPGPLETFERREQQARIRKALSALKPDQVSLLVLRGEGFSLNEISTMLSMNPGSTGTLLARADAALRKEYIRLYGKQ